MSIDLERVIKAAAQAALEDSRSSHDQARRSGGKSRGLSPSRTFLIGAGLVTAGRLIAATRGRNVLENLQQRLVEYEQSHFDRDANGNDVPEDEHEEPEDEYEEPEDEHGEEPEDEYEEEPEDEYEEKPEDEYEEDEEYDEDFEPSEGDGARR